MSAQPLERGGALVAHAVESIRELEGRWPSTRLPESLYLTYEWLESQEGWNTPRPLHVALHDRAREAVVAVLPAYLLEDPEQHRFDNCPRLLLDVTTYPRDLAGALPPDEGEALVRARDELAGAGGLAYPALVANAGNGAIAGYAAEAGTDERALLAAFDEVADELGVPTRAYWYVNPVALPAIPRELRSRCYAEAAINAVCQLDIRWASFEDYLHSLSSNRRTAVRREIRAFEADGLRVELSDGAVLDAELAEMHANLQHRYAQAGDPSAILHGFDVAREKLGERLRVFVARAGATPVGFITALEFEGTLHVRQAGFAESRGSETRFVYFNTVFYAPIRYAIEAGLDRIDYSYASFEAKQARGCSTTPRTTHVRTNGVAPAQLEDYLRRYDRGVRGWLAAQGVESEALEYA